MARTGKAKQRLETAEVLSLHSETAARKEGPQRKKRFTFHDLNHVTPLNDTQQQVFNAWVNKNLGLFGYPGTGKTFLAFYLAFSALFLEPEKYDRVKIVRSIVPVRDVGFLPGELEEKISVYETPYKDICDELFSWKNSYDNLKEIGLLEFEPTSFVRGRSWNNSLIIVDEAQSLTESEFYATMSRVGKDSKIIFCADEWQSDLKKGEKSCYRDMVEILKYMNDQVQVVQFQQADLIVRSAFVRRFIEARQHLKL